MFYVLDRVKFKGGMGTVKAVRLASNGLQVFVQTDLGDILLFQDPDGYEIKSWHISQLELV